MSLETFGEWLYATPISTVIRDTVWIIPTVQSVHILAIAILISAALVTELRVAGVLSADLSLPVVARRFMPWIWRALVVLLATGTVLIVAEPGRTLGNTVFWVKVSLIFAALLMTLALRKPLLAADISSDVAPSRPIAWLMLAIWVIVIFCGRFIAYT